jgi:hypothetical protein
MTMAMRTGMRRFLASTLSRPCWCGGLALLLLAAWAAPGRAADATPEQAKLYNRLVAGVKTENLRRHIETLSALGSRVTGTEGCDRAARYILDYWKSLGLEDIHTESFTIAAPLPEPVDAAKPEDQQDPKAPRVESYLEIVQSGQRIRMFPLWPNSVRTSPYETALLAFFPAISYTVRR